MDDEVCDVCCDAAWISCPACGGEGLVGDDECIHCDGIGDIPCDHCENDAFY